MVFPFDVIIIPDAAFSYELANQVKIYNTDVF